MSDIKIDSVWVWKFDGSQVQVDSVYEGTVCFYDISQKYGELNETDFLSSFTPFKGYDMSEEKIEEARRYFYVQYSYTDVYGCTGIGSTAAEFKGMLNHEEFNNLVKKDSLNKHIELKSVFILTWVEMSKEDYKEFIR